MSDEYRVKDLQSGDLTRLPGHLLAVVYSGQRRGETAIMARPDGADAIEAARGTPEAYGCALMTVEQWAATCSKEEAFVLDPGSPEDDKGRQCWWATRLL